MFNEHHKHISFIRNTCLAGTTAAAALRTFVKAFFKGSLLFGSGGKARVPSNICQPLLETTVASGKSTVVAVMAAGTRTSLLLPVLRAEKSN